MNRLPIADCRLPIGAPSGVGAAPLARELLAAAEACDRAADAPSEEEQMRAVLDVFSRKEVVRLGLMRARMQRLSQTPHARERLPLCDEGHEFGRVLATVPADEFFHLALQRNFGLDGFYDSGGLEDYLETRPACRVKTVSGKTTVGWTPESGSGESGTRVTRPSGRGRVRFGPGTMQFAT